MTKRTSPNGREVVELGTVERWVVGAGAAALLAVASYIAWTVTELDRRVSKIEGRLERSIGSDQ